MGVCFFNGTATTEVYTLSRHDVLTISAMASGQNSAHEAILKALDSPLLNDNKITGAKNVLLLIVSGSQEITIDEIGEINDHIQSEAGHGANIIMGVGEDTSLEEAISVTIIATGFNVEQQDEITNTEAKKVIHALEDDHSVEQDFSTKEREPAIISPAIELNKDADHTETKPEPPVVKHTLDLDELEADQTPEDTSSKMDLVPTTQAIRDMDVSFETVTGHEDDFVITDVTPKVEESIETPAEEEQITLTFDLPINAAKESKAEPEQPMKFELTDDVKNMEVHDYIELITVTESDEEGESRYALDDYLEFESAMNPRENAPKKEAPEVTVDEEVVFEKKVVEKPVEPVSEPQQDIDPVNSPISEILKERAAERRRKMKEFNYKFNNAKIDDMEKEPAYKRQGVDLDQTKHSADDAAASRTSVSLDDNDDMQLRSNNSFLHDNVD